jgi:hypothetical protein
MKTGNIYLQYVFYVFGATYSERGGYL